MSVIVQTMIDADIAGVGFSFNPSARDDNYYYFGSTNGFTPFTSAHDIGAHKAYLRVSKLPEEAPHP